MPSSPQQRLSVITVSKEMKLVVQILLGIGAGLLAYSEKGGSDHTFHALGALIVALIAGWAAGLFITTRPA
jgi:hypothetical protein